MTPPPPATSEFAVGDSTRAVAERGYRFVPVYQFGIDGHQYAFAKAHSGEVAHDLVFIDTKLACASDEPIEELTPWYWVDDPGGLSYLASRLRQACGLEAPTPARSPFSEESSAGPEIEQQPPDTDMEGDVDWAPARSTFGSDMADVGKQGAIVAGELLVGMAALVFAWPALLAAGVVSEVAGSSADAKGQQVETHAYELSLPAPEEDVRQSLGPPAAQFRLPTVDTKVLAYAVDTDHVVYVGVCDGQAVWIHGPEPWLEALEQDAKEMEKHGKQDR